MDQQVWSKSKCTLIFLEISWIIPTCCIKLEKTFNIFSFIYTKELEWDFPLRLLIWQIMFDHICLLVNSNARTDIHEQIDLSIVYLSYFSCFLGPREGVIMERPLNDLFHDRRDVILTSWMAVSNIFLMVAII